MSNFRGIRSFPVYSGYLRVFALSLCAIAALSLFPGLSAANAEAANHNSRLAEIDGLRLVSHETEGKLAAVCIFIGVGSAHESPGSNGVTSLLNNLILSTNPASGSSAVLEIEDLGGTVEVETGFEYSCFKLAVPRNNMAAALSLLGRAIAEPPLTQPALRAVRRQVVDRAGRRRDMPVELGYGQYLRKTYSGGTYGFHPEGEPESLTALSLREVSDWHAANYVRGNITVSICADFSPDSVEKMVHSALNPLSGSPRRVPSHTRPPVSPEASAPYSIDSGLPSADSVALVGYAAPPVGSPDYAAAVLVEAVLANGMGSRLFRSFRADEKLAYSFGSMFPVLSEGCRLTFYVSAADDTIDDAARRITSSVESLRSGDLSEAELARARGKAIGDIELEADGLVARARRAGLGEMMGVGPDYWDGLPDKLNNTDAKDVVKAARKYLDGFTLVVLRPGKGSR